MELYFGTFQDWDLLILENIKKKHFIYSKISRCHAKAACMPCMAKAKAELLQKTQKREFENYIFNKTNSYVYREIQDGPWTTWCNEKMISVPKT